MKTETQKRNQKNKIIALALQVTLGLGCLIGIARSARAVDIPDELIRDGFSNTVHFGENRRAAEHDSQENAALCKAIRERERRIRNNNFLGTVGRVDPSIPSEHTIDCPPEEEIPTPSPSPTPEASIQNPPTNDEERYVGDAQGETTQINDGNATIQNLPNALSGGGCTLAVSGDSSGILSMLMMTIPFFIFEKRKKNN